MVKFAYETGINSASHCQLSANKALSDFFCRCKQKLALHMLQVRVPCVLGNRKREKQRETEGESESKWERHTGREQPLYLKLFSYFS